MSSHISLSSDQNRLLDWLRHLRVRGRSQSRSKNRRVPGKCKRSCSLKLTSECTSQEFYEQPTSARPMVMKQDSLLKNIKPFQFEEKPTITATTPMSLSLTVADRTVLFRSWAKFSKQMTQVGIEVLTKVMEECPEIIDMFGYTKVSEPDVGTPNSHRKTPTSPRSPGRSPKARISELIDNSRFRDHALKFMQSISQLVEAIREGIENTEDMVYKFQQLGTTHRTVRVRGFRPVYWTLFTQQIVAVIVERSCCTFSGKSQRDALDDVWGRTIRFMIEHMRHGYDHGFAAAAAKHSDRMDFPKSTRSSTMFHRRNQQRLSSSGEKDVDEEDENEGEEEQGSNWWECTMAEITGAPAASRTTTKCENNNDQKFDVYIQTEEHNTSKMSYPQTRASLRTRQPSLPTPTYGLSTPTITAAALEQICSDSNGTLIQL